MTSHHMLESSSLVQQRVRVLSEAASVVADLQVRNKGTIGGSLAHADPAADLPAPVVALEAQIHTAGWRPGPSDSCRPRLRGVPGAFDESIHCQSTGASSATGQ
jgi:hypothetical protein